MVVMITYDIETPKTGESKNKEIKDKMKTLGYRDTILVKDKPFYLPNTSLIKNDITSQKAKEELLNVAKACGAKVERLFVTEVSNPAAIPGEPF